MAQIFDATTAKVRMRVLTKPGKENFTWYSRKNDERKRQELIVEGMKRRFERHTSSKDAQVIQFYDNATGALIAEYKG